MLRRYGQVSESVFGLNGTDENSATFALGWLLDKSAPLFTIFLNDTINLTDTTQDRIIELQRFREDAGFTDIEIICPKICHLIVEAKCGWTLPSQEQLTKYVTRLGQGVNQQAIITISAATTDYASSRMPDYLSGKTLIHRSWLDIHRMVSEAREKTKSFEEKLWLRELAQHLKGYVSMQNPRDNQVFVVSLSKNPIKESKQYSWVDVVEQDDSYFHPVGNRWPVIPPNYIGFRYEGHLQSVHHIDHYDVVTSLATVNKNWPQTTDEHFVYKLGPAMRPLKEVRTGNIYPSGRVWCAIDTLLSGAFETISAARDETNRRLND